MWRDNDVRSHSDGAKVLKRPGVGAISLEYSTFAVDGRPDLGLVIYNPATPADADKVGKLIRSKG